MEEDHPPLAPTSGTDAAVPPPGPPVVAGPQRSSGRKVLLVVLLIIVIAGAATGGWWLGHHGAKKDNTTAASTSQKTTPAATPSTQSTVQGVQLDTAKNYGNKYASGVLPVGDGKYSTTGSKQGYVYACSQYARNLTNPAEGGAQARGPWFTNNNTEYDLNKKVHVSGSVSWQSLFSDKVSGSTRSLTTNGLPSHPTGVFPIAASDQAYRYDRNPNSIKAQSLIYNLPANPSYGSPNCMNGEAGVMLTGVPIFDGFDAGGRDAGAWEVQDDCSGHPQKDGEYHYHTLSSCIKDISVHTVIGFALDGFPITGPQVGSGNILTTIDLDECHGLTSQIVLDGKTVTMYHYVMTQDFPYSVSCFRSQAVQPPRPS
jgi:YHYH protein